MSVHLGCLLLHIRCHKMPSFAIISSKFIVQAHCCGSFRGGNRSLLTSRPHLRRSVKQLWVERMPNEGTVGGRFFA